jgi:hypothetical protein
MTDYFNLPYNSNVQTFFGNTTTARTSWQTWHRPSGTTMLYILLLGSGGNGGTGGVYTSSPCGGGGGGGSGQMKILLLPSLLLPETLYLSMAIGDYSYIQTWPSTDANDVVAYTQNGYDGSAGSSTAGGAGGMAGLLAGAGAAGGIAFYYNSIRGITGITGGYDNTPNATYNSSAAGSGPCISSHGAGGGGVNSDNTGNVGGYVQCVYNNTTIDIPGGAGAAALGQIPGEGKDGKTFFPYNLGGAGGGAGFVNDYDGKAGGDGAIGAGGGGGGASVKDGGAVGGAGGKGGTSTAILVAW